MPRPPTYVQYESSLGGYQVAHLFSREVSLHLCQHLKPHHELLHLANQGRQHVTHRLPGLGMSYTDSQWLSAAVAGNRGHAAASSWTEEQQVVKST